MSNVLVHKGKPRDYKNYLGSMIILDKIAAAFESMGHTVHRWMSACDDPFPMSVVFETAVIWCGQQNWYPPVKQYLKNMGTRILYCDVDVFGDWMDEGDTDYAFILQYSIPDTPAGGVGAFVCWQEFPLMSSGVADGGTRLRLNEKADELLVILQEDISLRYNPCISPVFVDCVPWVYLLLNYSRMPLLVRKHPKYSVSPYVSAMVDAATNARWSTADSLEQELAHVRAVACIDSHAGTKAIVANLPVLCFGRAMYRRDGVSYPCDCDVGRTVGITEELRSGRCSLSRERMKEYIAGVRKRTWHVSELPGRLEAYLADDDELALGYPK